MRVTLTCYGRHSELGKDTMHTGLHLFAQLYPAILVAVDPRNSLILDEFELSRGVTAPTATPSAGPRRARFIRKCKVAWRGTSVRKRGSGKPDVAFRHDRLRSMSGDNRGLGKYGRADTSYVLFDSVHCHLGILWLITSTQHNT